MFTYREFIDGAHEYRKKIKKQRTEALDREYEQKRYEVEEAFMSVVKIDDPEKLANFYLQSSEIFEYLKKIPDKTALTQEQCFVLAKVLSFSKEIDHQSKSIEGDLDYLYSVSAAYLDTTGGLIYNLEGKGIPSVILKIPADRKNSFHEAFIVDFVFSSLRSVTDSFPFLFANWCCDKPFHFKSKMLSLCDFPGPQAMFLYENLDISEKYTLHDYILRGQRSIENIISILLQVTGSLHLAFKKYKFTHYDLHSKNIVLQNYSHDFEWDFDEFKMLSKRRTVIIDPGLSYCEFKWDDDEFLSTRSARKKRIFREIQRKNFTKFGSIQNKLIGVSYDKPFPLGDIFRILFDVYFLVDSGLKQKLGPAISFFFSDRTFMPDKNYHQGSSGFLNTFTLTPFRQDLLEFTYEDFAFHLLRAYHIDEPEFTPREILYDTDDLKFASATKLPYGRLGILITLDEDKAKEMDKTGILQSRQEFLDEFFKDMKDNEIIIQKSIRNLFPLKRFVLENLKDILEEDFLREYQMNSERFVYYSRVYYLFYSRVLLVRRTDTFLKIPPYFKEESFYEFRQTISKKSPMNPDEMLEKTFKIEEILASNKRRLPINVGRINWLNMYLPAVKKNLYFFKNWEKDTS